MAEEFEGGVCGSGSWWNSPRNLFRSSPCSLAANEINGFGWQSHDLIMDMKVTRSSDDSAGSVSDGSGSVVLHDLQNKPQQMMGINTMSSSTADDHWNQDLIHNSGKSEDNYSNIPQEAAAINKDWSFRNFGEDSTINSFKQMNQNFHVEPLMSSFSSTTSTECAASTGQSCGFPLNSASYSSYTSSLLQTLFDVDSQPQQQQFMDIQPMNYSSAGDYNQVNNSNGIILPSMSMVIPSFTKQHEPSNQSLPFTNTEPIWNATTEALSNFPASFLPSTKSQFLPSSPNNKKAKLPSFVVKHQNGEVAKKASNEPAFKRPRIETPSPLPTFKVRKEKLGDRVTALQQLVSPFGKTDTASVLHEAIEYIKFLHDQVSALSTPYLKYGSPPVQNPQVGDKVKDQEGLIKDLKSRGLCLVPISSTFPVASETTSDFWTPTFGGSFK